MLLFYRFIKIDIKKKNRLLSRYRQTANCLKILLRSLCRIIYIFMVASGIFLIQADAVFSGSRLSIKPLLIVDEEYTDNIDLASSNESQDFISIWSPGIIIEHKSKTHTASFNYNFGYSRYEKNDQYNSWRHNANINLASALNRHTLISFSDNFRITEDPNAEFIDKIFEDIDTYFMKRPEPSGRKEETRRERLQYLTNSAYLSLTHQFSRNGTLSFSYFNNLLINEDDTIRDERAHYPSFQFNYWITPKRFMMDGGMDYSFNDTSDALLNPGFVEQTLSPFIGAIYWILPNRFNATPRLTYSRKTISDTPDPDSWEETLSPSLGLQYIFRESHMDISVNGQYEIRTGSDNPERGDSEYDFEKWGGTVQIGKQFNERFRGFVQYTQEHNDYLIDDLRDYQAFEPSVGFTYTLAEKLPLTFRVGYNMRDNEAKGKTSNITVNGSGSWRFSRDGELRFRASSGYDDDEFNADQLGKGMFYNGDLSLNYNFTNDLKGVAYGLYEKYQYDQDGEETRNDERQLAGVGLFYRPIDWLMARLDYMYLNYNSTEPLDDYTESRIILKIFLEPKKSYQIN